MPKTIAALVVAQICATHPLACQFNEELQAIYDKRKLVVDYLAREANEVASQAEYEYRYNVVSATHEPFLPLTVKLADPVRIVRKWLNKHFWDHLNQKYGVDLVRGKKEVDVSVVYYRVANVVVSYGSGKTFIDANKMFSDEEWEEVKGCHLDKYVNNAA